jgi:hypothetical protein
MKSDALSRHLKGRPSVEEVAAIVGKSPTTAYPRSRRRCLMLGCLSRWSGRGASERVGDRGRLEWELTGRHGVCMGLGHGTEREPAELEVQGVSGLRLHSHS